FVRDTVWVAASWYRPGGQHSPEEIARQYLSMVLEGVALRDGHRTYASRTKKE
ncbi:TetR family transcriptional regulator, partial [Streptomyces sp. NPDC096319]